mmetsp:Transcript_11384/g.22056  ORF Transcript_11384/g.22056 Transcript_11384/m.22056 type:complete len:512 (+) Transcript_11384:312-1847(+)
MRIPRWREACTLLQLKPSLAISVRRRTLGPSARRTVAKSLPLTARRSADTSPLIHQLVYMCLVSTAHSYSIPHGLRTYMHSRVSHAIKGTNASPDFPSLVVSQLEHLAADKGEDDAARNAWFHTQGLRVATTLTKEPRLIENLLEGSVGVAALIEYSQNHERRAWEMFQAITGRHNRLRKATSADPVPAAAAEVAADKTCAKEGAAEVWHDREDRMRYAAAAAQMGARSWVRLGIDWCAQQAKHHFIDGGAVRRALRAAKSRSYAEHGRPPTDEQLAAIVAEVERMHPPQRKVKLLDVGSCGSMFGGYEHIDATALDLQPNPDVPTVLQCDFLELQVSSEGTEPRIEPEADSPAGYLRSLPAASFDAVVLSLVLSYLPLPSQRADMIAKARSLLRPVIKPHTPDAGDGVDHSQRNGLLMIIETMSVDKKEQTWKQQVYLQQWVEVIESLGFSFIKHTKMLRSHALLFVTTPQRTAPTDATLELRMRSHVLAAESASSANHSARESLPDADE